MLSPTHPTSPRCWECEEPTDEPATVTLRTACRAVATLTLCTRCYRTCYFPLASDRPDGTLLIEPGGPGREPPEPVRGVR